MRNDPRTHRKQSVMQNRAKLPRKSGNVCFADGHMVVVANLDMGTFETEQAKW